MGSCVAVGPLGPRCEKSCSIYRARSQPSPSQPLSHAHAPWARHSPRPLHVSHSPPRHTRPKHPSSSQPAIRSCHVARVESAQALDNLREGRTRRWDREARTYVHRSIRPRTRIARAPRSGRGRCIRRRTAHPRSCRLHSPHRRHTRPRDRSGRGRSRRWWRSRPRQRGRPSASSPPPQTRRRKRTARLLSNRGHVRCIHAGTGGRGRRIRRPRSRRRTHRRPMDQCTTRGRYTRADTSMQSSRHPSNSERKRTRQPGRIHGRGGRRSRRRRSIGLPGPMRPAERSPRSIEGPVSILVDRAPSDRARA